MASASLLRLDALTSYSASYSRTKQKVGGALRAGYSKIRYTCNNTPTRIARGITLDVTVEQIEKLLVKQGGKCALSGVVMTGLSGCLDKVSIDRKDSTKSYTLKNIQLVTQQVNKGKMDFSDEDFIRMCCNVAIKNGYVKL